MATANPQPTAMLLWVAFLGSLGILIALPLVVPLGAAQPGPVAPLLAALGAAEALAAPFLAHFVLLPARPGERRPGNELFTRFVISLAVVELGAILSLAAGILSGGAPWAPVPGVIALVGHLSLAPTPERWDRWTGARR